MIEPSHHNPLSRFPLVSTDSVEEAESILGKSLAPSRIMRVADQERFHFAMNGVAFGSASLIFNDYSSDTNVEVDIPGDSVSLLIGSGAVSEFQIDGSRVQLTANTGILVTNTDRMRIERPEHSGVLVLRASMSDLLAQFELLTDRHHRGSLRFDRNVPLAGGYGAVLKRQILFLSSELDRDDCAIKNPALRRCYDQMQLTAMLSLPHDRQEELFGTSGRKVAPGVVHCAEEFMRAHLSEPITIADLLAVCACSRRALHTAFRSARGYSPMEFLTEQRLQAARRALQDSDEAESVSSIALDCGFGHLGRFSQVYRKRFGERPSEMLANARGK